MVVTKVEYLTSSPIEKITLELSEGAALAILELCGQVCGTDENTLRHHTDVIYDHLNNILFKGHHQEKDPYILDDTKIKFKELMGVDLRFLQ